MVDSADQLRLPVAAWELAKLGPQLAVGSGEHVLVLANKQDVPGALPAVAVERALGLPGALPCKHRIIGCSALAPGTFIPEVEWLLAAAASKDYSDTRGGRRHNFKSVEGTEAGPADGFGVKRAKPNPNRV